MSARDELPAGVVRAELGDLLTNPSGGNLYRVDGFGRSRRWLVVTNLMSGHTTRRKADDFELWARP